MYRMRLLYIIMGCFIAVFTANSQPVRKMPPVPLSRQLFHDNIDMAQKEIAKLDGKADNQFIPTRDEELNLQINYSLWNKVDDMQADIELDSGLLVNGKLKFLRGLNQLLVTFADAYRDRQIQGVYLPELIAAFGDAMVAEKKQESIVPVIEANNLEVGQIIIKNFSFEENRGINYAKDVLLLKTCDRYPQKTIAILNKRPDVFFADSLIAKIAYQNQEQLYNYASSGNELSKKIQQSTDPLVQLISKLANMKTGRMFYPFLDDLFRGKKTFEQIDSLLDNDEKYYSLLVQTQVDYARRLRNADTPFVMKDLTSKLTYKAKEVYVNDINGLHDSTDRVRFRKIETLSPEELYYLAVLAEDEIYTSSFVSGVYPRIMKQMGKGKSDSLMQLVHYDHFKKWIKMCANFNLLDDYLKQMDSLNASALMRSFVNDLDKTSSLEDAVDVADSYASISNPALQKLILAEINKNYKQAFVDSFQRGQHIYGILKNIFLSKDTANSIDLTAAYGIQPIYKVPNKLLRDTSGRINIQQYFYGDKDGVSVFNSFIKNFKNGLWKFTDKKYWIEVSSMKGIPVTIYANKPLADSLGLDELAQDSLDFHFRQNDINPSVVIFRGHSYNVRPDIKTLVPSAKVVLLGSCGGYHSISEALDIAPEAHIIASKQVGSGTVNQPMINTIAETLRSGKDLNWPQMWKDLAGLLKKNPYAIDKFEDYIPPYKNLGAIFLMAFTKVSG